MLEGPAAKARDLAEGEYVALSVQDDGVGMPVPSGGARAGLGTSIIEALAKQLRATIDVSDAQPGTRVALDHRPVGGGTRGAEQAEVLV